MWLLERTSKVLLTYTARELATQFHLTLLLFHSITFTALATKPYAASFSSRALNAAPESRRASQRLSALKSVWRSCPHVPAHIASLRPRARPGAAAKPPQTHLESNFRLSQMQSRACFVEIELHR
eukprot:6202419-Pleurochrysis_carterae.AAC.8